MGVICRFAPSPTGLLHVGNVRTALINWLFAKKNNGKFILRIDDTDNLRSKEQYITQIKEDLSWLNLDYQECFHQSSRFERYKEITNELIAKGHLYPCYETKTELDFKRKRLLSRGKPPIYDRSALNLTKEEISSYKEEGRKPHFRFKLPQKIIKWNDLIRGEIQFDSKNLSDPILIREDLSMTYMLCSVIDDIDYNITHIVRGEDHISNTAIAFLITEVLDAKNPTFAHLSLLKTKDDEISKRTGGFDIKTLKDNDIEPITICSLLAKMGSSDSIELNTMEELLEQFDLSKFSKSSVIYNPEDLIRLNQKYLINLDYGRAQELINTKFHIQIDQDFWELVRPNIASLQDVLDWWKICKKELGPIIDSDEDVDFLKQTIELLPKDDWDETTWQQWIKEIKMATGKSGKNLFMPIRKALTAMEKGPELKNLLPAIGKEKVIKRLQGYVA